MSARIRSRARAGFTLVELMLALVAGSFVVSGAYYLSDVSARLFHEQARRTETQASLRVAAEQLRKDIGRAGFLGVRDTRELLDCNGVQGGASVSPLQQQAVRVIPVAGGGSTLFLTGNFTTSDQYPLAIESTANMLVLAREREGFRRSFVDPRDGVTFLPQRFLSAFVPDPAQPNIQQGRMVAIQDLSTGRMFLSDIMSLNAAGPDGPQIFINPPLPTVGGCIPSMTTLVVAPISTVRYAVENPAAIAELARFAQAANTLAGGARMVLTRTEINMRTNGAAAPTPIVGTTRMMLDFINNANSFRVEATFDRNCIIGFAAQPPALAYTATPDVVPPVQLRSLVIDLLGGSAEQIAGPANDRQSRVLAARRLAHMEVFMPNMARNPGIR
jgi:prepilin-type N-terminal cleavage/methylation domain-containing protein